MTRADSSLQDRQAMPLRSPKVLALASVLPTLSARGIVVRPASIGL